MASQDPAHHDYNDINPPPAPPQHRNLVSPEMSRGPAYPGQQSYYNNNPNPFNDSNVTLSQRSSRTSSIMGGPAMADARHNRSEPLRGYSDSLHSGSSESGHYNSSHMQPGHRSPGEGGMLMGTYPPYSDNPYNRYSSVWDNTVEQPINPDDIADDGDDGLGPANLSKRRSILGRARSNQSLPIAPGIVSASTASKVGEADPHGIYGPVTAADQRGFERGKMLAEEAAARKRKRLIFIVLGILVVIAVIVAGTVAGILTARKSSDSGLNNNNSAAADDATLLTSQSSEIKNLMNNKNLHRVFPGMDYTPFNAQYPDCLVNPPSQNNVTRDMAVLSQLTNTIRLYGTDCNQTDMVLEAFNVLGIKDMKVWLGVWLDNNQTTNDRGMNAMWDILSRKSQDPFAGVIIGNEVLFRKDMTLAQLGDVVSGVRSNFSSLGYNLPIAIADLGDNWTAALVEVVDVVMSNVHPFFAGVTAQAATAWTMNFWETKDVALTAGDSSKKNIISETGWPSGGGNDCGAATCTSDQEGAIASVDNMNIFMEGFVCPALKNGTTYFW